ncbi:hypothetical protein PD5205_00045 [Xanthomonas fragariae]|uniref:Uncharacterized protein n=1 Tax=Xanthomonas fragariae TaxID=48664 RepID=A0A1Y6HCV9_9XANT|nr:hypothetical protein NBC2815_00040 [Xanthomonas fragariae]SMQ97316.1 hypothetical protein PD885_00044 [Xanthomonas fragariae]SMR01369.1 hypothetical protein PD5205_00045 [Xanthomonas fragariae]
MLGHVEHMSDRDCAQPYHRCMPVETCDTGCGTCCGVGFGLGTFEGEQQFAPQYQRVIRRIQARHVFCRCRNRHEWRRWPAACRRRACCHRPGRPRGALVRFRRRRRAEQRCSRRMCRSGAAISGADRPAETGGGDLIWQWPEQWRFWRSIRVMRMPGSSSGRVAPTRRLRSSFVSRSQYKSIGSTSSDQRTRRACGSA